MCSQDGERSDEVRSPEESNFGDPSTAGGATNFSNEQPWWQKGWRSWNVMEKTSVAQVFFAFCLLVATTAQAWVGGCQWVAMRRQTDILDNTTKKQLRAWLAMDSATLTWDEETSIATLAYPVKNYGQTPAYNIVHAFDYGYVLPPFDGEPIQQEQQPDVMAADKSSEMFSGPGHVETHRGIFKISAEDKAKLDAGQLQLLILGTIEFRDVFDDDRLVVFVLRWGGPYGTKEMTWEYQADETDFTDDFIHHYYLERYQQTTKRLDKLRKPPLGPGAKATK